jgi:hypothetical protein
MEATLSQRDFTFARKRFTEFWSKPGLVLRSRVPKSAAFS